MQTQDWFNTPGMKPLSLSSLRGRVVLVDFWTYTCINCIRTLPYLKAWDAAYRHDGLTIVGVETPEFAFERDAGNVANAIKQFGLRYPVVQDNEMGTWNAYGNEYWPADYLIDAHGQVRYAAFGEGDYDKTETAIRALLAEARRPGRRAQRAEGRRRAQPAGDARDLPRHRARRRLAGTARRTACTTTAAPRRARLALNEFAYSGTWKIAAQPAEAVSNAGIDVEFQAKNVYLVLSSAGARPRQVQVLLDGKPIAAADAGSDVHGGSVTVRGQRLYTLVSLPRSERRRLSLRFAPGVSGFAFTFG